MKRITVSLPDELVERIKRVAGEGRVSAYVAAALTEYQERETLDQILADWEAETPTIEDVRRQVEAEFDRIGLIHPGDEDDRMAG
jgi:Arc/MetJ-type ribon-helix-helix transcriptional regulator